MSATPEPSRRAAVSGGLVPSPPGGASIATIQPAPTSGGDAQGASVRAPLRIGRFTVLDVLGEGGMGRVYAAYDPSLDRRIALKVLLGAGERPDQTARIRREAHAMARIAHPNVCPVYEVGEHEGQTWIAMEFVEGCTLAAWQRAGHPWTAVLEMYTAVGRGLAAAHAAGMLHRDFKPLNVLVGRDGRPRIIDFGLVRGDGDPEDRAPATPTAVTAPDVLASPLTRDGSLLGTPGYMPPEQYAGGPLDARCDQFAFCVALYEALFGQPPFGRGRLPVIMEHIAEGPAEPPATDVPPSIRDAVLRGLSADPADRWPSMQALLDELGWDPEADRSSGAGVRLAVLTVLVLWIVFGSAHMSQADYGPQVPWASYIGVHTLLVGFLAAMGYRLRHRLATPHSRRLAFWFLGLLATPLAIRLVAWTRDVELGVTVAFELAACAALAILGSLIVVRWTIFVALPLLVGGMAIALRPDDPLPVAAIATSIAMAIAFLFTWDEARRAGVVLTPSRLWSVLRSPAPTPPPDAEDATRSAPPGPDPLTPTAPME